MIRHSISIDRDHLHVRGNKRATGGMAVVCWAGDEAPPRSERIGRFVVDEISLFAMERADHWEPLIAYGIQHALEGPR